MYRRRFKSDVRKNAFKKEKFLIIDNNDYAKFLQTISMELLGKGDMQSIYNKVIDVAMKIMNSDFASMQMLFKDKDNENKLELLSYHGFNHDTAEFWKVVSANKSGSACGEAMRKCQRVIVSNIEECDFIQGTDDLECFLQAGIHAVQSTPLFSRNGKMLGMISTHWHKHYTPTEVQLSYFDVLSRMAADLIERKIYEQTLCESEEKYRVLFENMNEGFFVAEMIYDENGNPIDYIQLMANPALERVLGFSPNQLHGEALNTQSSWLDIFNNVVITGQPTAFEGHSESLMRNYTINVYSPRKGQFACHLQDITERKKLEKELENQQMILLNIEKEKSEALESAIDIKNEFLYLISHEFKTPITIINSVLQTIDSYLKKGNIEKIDTYLNMIQKNNNRQLRLANNLLEITRLNSGQLKLNYDYFDIIFVTKQIFKSISIYADKKQIELKFISKSKCLYLYFDEEKYERIVFNLLSNAIKFTPNNKSITVRLSIKIMNDKKFICISIKDEGIGIPKDKQDIIFDRFGQVNNSISRPAEGTGLGLYLVKMLVEASEGKLDLNSKPGEGSTFTVFLPYITINDGMKSPDETQNRANLHNSEMRIINSASIEFSDIY